MRAAGRTDGHEEGNSRFSDLCESTASPKQTDKKESYFCDKIMTAVLKGQILVPPVPREY
jgi:hypothetical protein